MAQKPTPEFRAEAVRVALTALTSGLPRKQVAANFGIGFSTLSRWIQQDRRNPERPSAQSDLEREVAELRKENRWTSTTTSGPIPRLAGYAIPWPIGSERKQPKPISRCKEQLN